MAINKQPDDAQHHVECTIEGLEETQNVLAAEKAVAHAKGYISGLRLSQLIEHLDFKLLDTALDNALRDWHDKHDKL